MLSQKRDGRSRVLYGLRLVNLLVKLDGLVPVVAFIGELDVALDAPKQIGNERDKAVRRVPAGNLAHETVDSENLLEHDDAWSISTRRQRKVAVELATIERFNRDHSHRLPRIGGPVFSHPLLPGLAHAQEVTHAAVRSGLDRKVRWVGREDRALHSFVNCLLATRRLEQLIRKMHFDIRLEEVKRHTNVRACKRRQQLANCKGIRLHL